MLTDGRAVAAPAAPAVVDDPMRASLPDGMALVLARAAFRSCTACKHVPCSTHRSPHFQ